MKKYIITICLFAGIFTTCSTEAHGKWGLPYIGTFFECAAGAADAYNTEQQYRNGEINQQQRVENHAGNAGGCAGGVTGAYVGASSGAAGGAMVGATVGSVVPVVGTAIGGTIGGFVGGIGGGIGGYMGGDWIGSRTARTVTGWFW